MPTKTNIIINSLDANNKKVSNTISYVNPNISNNVAVELAQRIASLTNDSYSSAERVDRTEITSVTKTPTTFSAFKIQNQDATVDGDNVSITLTVNQTGSGGYIDLTFVTNSMNEWQSFPKWQSNTSAFITLQWSIVYSGSGQQNQIRVRIIPTAGKVAQTITGILTLPETNSYEKKDLNITITLTEGE